MSKGAGDRRGVAVRQTLAVDEEPARSIPLEELRDPQRWREEMDKAAERVRSLKRRKAELKTRHWGTWSAVKRAVDDADPERLLAMGCPNDEYDDAVVYLADRVLERDQLSLESLSGWFRAIYGSEPNADGIRLLLDSLEAIP
jgi:hypothetical protein